MKKTTRIIICAALFCIGAGIICAVVGAIVGGKPANMPAIKDMQNNIHYYEYSYGSYGSGSRGSYNDDYYNDYFDYYYGDYYNRGSEGSGGI